MRASFVVAVGLAVASCGGGETTPGGSGGAGAGGSGGGEGGSSVVDPCPAPGRLVGDACVEPGISDDGCPAGSLGQPDGSCLEAGVPEGSCGEGFVHDGAQGCTPILPATPCEEEGTMAIPGDSTCRPIMPCGQGTWGDIPVDDSTIFVDPNYAGGSSDGTQTNPFTQLDHAIAAASGGELIAIAEGGYIADFVIDKPLTLHGVCPTLVRMYGDPFIAGPALLVTAGGSGSTFRGIRFTDIHTSHGVVVEGATNVTFDQIWVRINIIGGLDARWHADDGPSSITITDSLIEGNGGNSVFIWGSSALIEGTVIRDTADHGDNLGIGLTVASADAVPAEATLRGSKIERARLFGVHAFGASVTIEDSVVREILPDSTGAYGRGINAQYHPDSDLRADVTLRRSVVEDGHGVGVFAATSDLLVEDTVIQRFVPDTSAPGSDLLGLQSTTLGAPEAPAATLVLRRTRLNDAEGVALFASGATVDAESLLVQDVLPDQDDLFGRGLYFRTDANSGTETAAEVRGSVVERTHDVGVYANGATVTIEGILVRETQPDAISLGGRGMSLQYKSEVDLPSEVTIDASVLEDNGDHGIFIHGSTVTVRSSVVRTTAPGSNGDDGRGIGLQIAPLSGTPSSLLLENSLLDGNHGTGLLLSGSTLEMNHSAIVGTQPAPAGGLGRGLSVQSLSPGQGPATAIVRNSRITDNHEFGAFVLGSEASFDGCLISGTRSVDPGDGELLYGDGISMLEEGHPTIVAVHNSSLTDNDRAALLYFGGSLTLGDDALSCNAIDLVDGSSTGAGPSLDNQGNNQCGCPSGTSECQWQSTTVIAPAPLQEADANVEEETP